MSRVKNARRSWYCPKCGAVYYVKRKTCRCGGRNLEYFQSKKELQRWRELLTLERAGKIANLKRQVKFDLPIKTPGGRTMTHTVDYEYSIPDAPEVGLVLEDAKGYDTLVGHIKRELVRITHNRVIRLY